MIDRKYLIIGDMPHAVQTYLDTNNLQDVLAVQKSILQEYKRDIMKYKRDDSSQKLYIDEVFLEKEQAVNVTYKLDLSDL